MEAEWEGCGMNASGYQRHPLSAAFPDMSGADVDALAGDIEKHGQAAPGVILDGMILDGWHRYLACIRADVSFTAFDYDGDDPVAFVLSKNLHRRHLTASQRAGCVVATMEWRPHGGQKSRVAPGATRTIEEMAKAAEVSPRTIRHAKAADEAGLGAAVRNGVVSAKRAAEVADLPQEKRKKALADGPKPERKKPEAPDETADLKAQIEELTEERDNLADTARDMEIKLTAFETTDPDEQQKEIIKLQKRIDKLEFEIKRLTRERNASNGKNNQLIREVRRLQKKAGRGK